MNLKEEPLFHNKLEILFYLFQNLLKGHSDSYLKEELILITIETSKADCNTIKTLLCFENKNNEKIIINIKFIQILEALHISFSNGLKLYSLNINLNYYLQPFKRNAIPLSRLDSFFKKGAKQKLENILNLRIFEKIYVSKNMKEVNLFNIPKELFSKINCYLDITSLCKMSLLSNCFYEFYYKNNYFWEELYTLAIGKTGFKLKNINWKEVYINKLKEKKLKKIKN